MTYYVYEIHSKVIRKKGSRNLALFTLGLLNKQRGELGFAMMDKDTYERNYGS